MIATLRAAGHEALWAGGCVRDLVLGREPKDYDVATSATPEEVTRCFERTVLVGAAYGVVRVLVENSDIEVATFRTDGGYSDGRRPDQVTWTTAEDDVKRRDFTINGLLGDPLSGGDTPHIIDHVGGLADLESGLIRAIGDPDARFKEDHLRILRAVRFAARLDFEIHEETWAAVVRHGPSLESVSAERIRDELQGMWTEGRPAQALRLLTRSQLLPLALPELVVTDAAIKRLEGAARLSPAVGWATVMLDIGEPGFALPSLGKRLRLSRALSDKMKTIVGTVRTLQRYDTLGLAARKRLLRPPEAEDALIVARLAARADQLDGHA
ncbi:MAG: CCA tRNA nucleotidyltransferase, partial [Myxococcota bacterium]|nr:CCA tRNA nucleotidyltransferase [Myxococcota bacterium]